MNKQKVNIIIGRFQPFTTGHKSLVETLYNKNGLSVCILYIDNKKFDARHPFNDETVEKCIDVSFTKSEKDRYFTDIPYIKVKNANIVEIGKLLSEQGLEPVLLGCGTDRYESYKRMADNPKYREQGKLSEDFNVIVLDRDEDNVSGTKVRQALKNDDKESFNKMTAYHKILNTEQFDILYDKLVQELNDVKENLIDLSEYVYIYENKNEGKRMNYDSCKNVLRNLLKKFNADNNISFNSKINTKHNKTIAEIEFPSVEDENNIDMLNNIVNYIKSVHTDWDIKVLNNNESAVFGRENGCSSHYFSYKIEVSIPDSIEPFIYYIINRTYPNSILKTKDLTPEQILSGKTIDSEYGKAYLFTDKDIYYNNIITGINKKLINTGNEDKAFIGNILLDILKEITNKNNYNISGSFTDENINEFFNDSKRGNIDIDLKNVDIHKLKKGDIACIEKDFGEILGPVVFNTLFGGNCNISFPLVSNNQLIDYYINGFGVSAKQYGGGGTPSGTKIFSNIVSDAEIKDIDELKINLNDIEPKDRKYYYNKSEIDFIKQVCSTYKVSTLQQQILLIKRFVIDLNNSVFNDKQTELFMKINTNPNNNNFDIKVLNQLVGDDPHDFFETLYKNLNYTETSANKIKLTQITADYWNKTDDKIKLGILLYPLYKIAIDNINKKYRSTDINNDVISNVINKQIQMKQVYLGINKNEMKLLVVSSEAERWYMKMSGISVYNIFNNKLGVHIIK